MLVFGLSAAGGPTVDDGLDTAIALAYVAA